MSVRRILKLPFQFSFVLFSNIAKLLYGAKVAARHSILTDAFTPFLSDIDMTFFTSSREQERKLIQFHRRCRFLFPYYGEVVCYSDDRLAFLRENNLNLYEVDRDPSLKEAIGAEYLRADGYSKHQAAAYIIWSALHDIKNLKKRPARRLSKWQHHFQQIQALLKKPPEVSPERLLSSIIETVTELAGQNDAAIRIKLSFLFDYIFQHGSLDKIPAARLAEEYIWIYFPVHLSLADAKIPPLSKDLLPMLLANVDHEIFSIIRKPIEPAEARKALLQLMKLLEKVRTSNPYPELDKKIETIRRAEQLFG